ncbi:toprim domain-containing protein [Phenylobacterium sp.]|uniref:DUF7146 domain-containing protein n=1 Tax=Phenylobacterium sp. TaxID=1871053 RepID=UPI00391D1F81
MSSEAARLSRELSARVLEVCRHYLSNGRREGAYWTVGDAANAKGRSLYVRLKGPDYGPGAAGHWTDAATGEHGDLLDLIATNRGLSTLAEVLDEACAFLSSPPSPPAEGPAPAGSPAAARRLFAAGRPIRGTPADRYLQSRGLLRWKGLRWLRYHPRCFYRGEHGDTAYPALLAGVTDLSGQLQGVQRLWLTPHGAKAPVLDPRRAMGELLGHAVRFGEAEEVLAAGEGVESVLSVREALPGLPAAAALSASHLAALRLPGRLHRLYVLVDADPAGCRAGDRLAARALDAGAEPILLTPRLGDFNEDLQRVGRERLRRDLRRQLMRADWARFASTS